MVFATSLDASEGVQIADDALPADERLELEELKGRVRRAMEKLPEKERALLLGYYFQGKTLEQAGGEIGQSKSWASRLHARAVETLKKVLEEEDDEEEEASSPRADSSSSTRRASNVSANRASRERTGQEPGSTGSGEASAKSEGSRFDAVLANKGVEGNYNGPGTFPANGANATNGTKNVQSTAEAAQARVQQYMQAEHVNMNQMSRPSRRSRSPARSRRLCPECFRTWRPVRADWTR